MLKIVLIWLAATGALGLLPILWRFPATLPFYILGDLFEALFHGAFHYVVWDLIRFVFSLVFLPTLIVGNVIVFFLESSRRPDRYRSRRR
jgi:hypothetical protein